MTLHCLGALPCVCLSLLSGRGLVAVAQGLDTWAGRFISVERCAVYSLLPCPETPWQEFKYPFSQDMPLEIKWEMLQWAYPVGLCRRQSPCLSGNCLLSLLGQHGVSINCPELSEFIYVTLMTALYVRACIFIIQIFVCVLDRKNGYNVIKRAIYFLLARQEWKTKKKKKKNFRLN